VTWRDKRKSVSSDIAESVPGAVGPFGRRRLHLATLPLPANERYWRRLSTASTADSGWVLPEGWIRRTAAFHSELSHTCQLAIGHRRPYEMAARGAQRLRIGGCHCFSAFHKCPQYASSSLLTLARLHFDRQSSTISSHRQPVGKLSRRQWRSRRAKAISESGTSPKG
jgi:hypothetical protein